MNILTALALLFASADDESLRIRIQEPHWSDSPVSLNASLRIVAEVLPGDALADAWVEVSRNRKFEWQRLPIPDERFLRVSAERTLVCPLLEPRTIPGARVGDTVWIRIVGARRTGIEDASWLLKIRLEEEDGREERLLLRLEERCRELQDLRGEFERDHRRLSRIDRQSRDAEPLDRRVADDLRSIGDAWASRLERLQALSDEWSLFLEEAETDHLVDAKRAARCRRSIDAFRRDIAGDDGVLGTMRQNLVRAVRAESAMERRVRFLATLDGSDRLLDLLEKPEGEVHLWRELLALRQLLRSVLKDQKDVTEHLARESKR